MSWLFPDSALEEDIIECAEYSMAMEGAFTDAFRRNFSARKEMKPHKRAMNKAILAGDYKTASKEAEECARILREAADEIKNTSPSMLSTIITDIALFTAIELSQIIFVIKIGQADRKQTIEKYAELDAKLASMEYDELEIPVLGMKYEKEYSETAEYMQKLKEKVWSLVKEGKPVPASMRNVDANRIFLSKVAGAERDGALKKNQKATNAGIATSVFATGLSMLANQVISLKRAKDGKIPPADVNGILKTCYRSLNQTADAYEKKAREYKFIGNGFESDLSGEAMEGFFSDIKANFQANKELRAKRKEYRTKLHKRENELYEYLQKLSDDFFCGVYEPDSKGVAPFLNKYIELCGDTVTFASNRSQANAAMAKLLANVMNIADNLRISNSKGVLLDNGYHVVVCAPIDGDDFPLVFFPNDETVSAVRSWNTDAVRKVYWDSGELYDNLYIALQNKAVEELNSEGATESEVVSSMGELEKAQAFVSAWLECHADDMEPLYGPEADILLKEFRAKHVAEELKEDPDYVDPHEERHCGRLTYLVEVKPDTTNITIPVCWSNRNTTVEYGSKEIEESLTRYYDAAIQPQNEEVITEPAQEGWAQSLAKKSLSKSNQIFVPKRVKEKQSAQRKDLNAQIKSNLQHTGDIKKFFKIAAQAMYPQKGWLFSTEGKAKCDEIAARQVKNTNRVISAEVENIGTLYYVLVHTKETGYDEWIMYMPQVEGVKTRNLHQAAREIALAQAQKMPGLPTLESQITFG